MSINAKNQWDMVISKSIYPCFALLRDSFTPKLTIYAISPLAALILKENTVELYATLSLHSQWNVIDYIDLFWWLDEWIVKTETAILKLNIIIDSLEASQNEFLRHSIICHGLTKIQISSSFTRKRISRKSIQIVNFCVCKIQWNQRGIPGRYLEVRFSNI